MTRLPTPPHEPTARELETATSIFAFEFGRGGVNVLLAVCLARHWLQNPARTVVTQPHIERALRDHFPPGSPSMAGRLHLVLGPQDQERERDEPRGSVPYAVCEHLLLPRPGKKTRYIDTHDVVEAVRGEITATDGPAIVIAQRDHLWRAARTVARAGFVALRAPNLFAVYDRCDGQGQVRGAFRFRLREAGARLYYRMRGWT